MPQLEVSSEQFAVQAIRFQLSGDWQVQDFNSFLEDIRFIHDRLFVVMAISDLVRSEMRENALLDKEHKYDEIDHSWTSLYFGSDRYYIEMIRPIEINKRQPFSDVQAAVELLRSPMLIDAIRIESPGWCQLIGNLNPLKVIAEFISRWRAEDTKRKAIESKERLEQQKLKNEREKTRGEQFIQVTKIRQEFITGILSQLPKSRRGQDAQRLAEIAEFAISPCLERLQRIADDPRVLEATVTSPGLPLPANTTVDPSPV